jgi:uncharacterized membrane protein
MATQPVRTREKDSLAQFLGWFSLGLGAVQIGAPGALCRLVGIRGDGIARMVMRLMGLREITLGLGILARPRPTMWLWSRVGGDGLDLSLLAVAAAKNGNGRARTAAAMANVLAVTAADVAEGVRLSRKQGEPQAGQLVRKAITVNRPRDEVERAWAGADELRQKVAAADATFSFDDAPGNRGTELAVELVHAPPAGDLGAAVARVAGKDLATQLSDDLRRFKQLVETGEIVRSDALPQGHLLAAQLKQRPAQPVEEIVR